MNIQFRFEKFGRNNVVLSVLMVLLGAVLFLWPGKSLELAARILGIALLVGAGIFGVQWYRDRHKLNAGYATLATAILCLVAGLIVLLAPRGLVSLLPKLIGVAVLLNGILNLAQALETRKQGGSWLSPLVMAALTILLGLFLILFAFRVMKVAVMVIGVISIYNGASNLWIESRYRKAGK